MNHGACDQPDYYRILGVLSDASAEEITAAFYALARRHHPDMAEQDDPSSQGFKAIVRAYEVLADPQRRREYDCQRVVRVPVKARRESSSDPPRGEGEFARRPSSSPATHGDIYAELPVAPEEARYGGHCQLRVTRYIACRACGGRTAGSQPCSVCQSSGQEARRELITIRIPPGLRSGSVLWVELPDAENPLAARRSRLCLQVVIRPCW